MAMSHKGNIFVNLPKTSQIRQSIVKLCTYLLVNLLSTKKIHVPFRHTGVYNLQPGKQNEDDCVYLLVQTFAITL